MPQFNAFIANLAAVLAADPLREKVLLAPSHRVGRQWLDQAAAALGGIANVRAATLPRLVRDYAEPVLRRKNLRPLTEPEKLAMAGRVLHRLAGESGEAAYFTRLPPSFGLVKALRGAVDELETASVRSAADMTAAIASPEKGAELAKLLRYCRGAEIRDGRAGPEAIHEAALEALAGLEARPPLLLLPASLGDAFTALEWAFIARWPEEDRLPVDEDEPVPGAELSFFTADCPVNEARQALRLLLENGTPLDRAEVVCLDPETYLPALCRAGLDLFGGRPEDLPMTFNAGLPGDYAAPVRLLSAWLEWLESGTPPEGLARMLDAGLLGEGWREAAPGVSAARLASRLRALPIAGSAEDYARQLGLDGEESETGLALAWLARAVRDIMPTAGGGGAEPDAALDAAERLLTLSVGRDGKLDAYARTSLLATIRQWLPHCGWPGFDAPAWLASLASGIRVMGLGPMPGKIHVADLQSGGHSGRPVTFVLGLDDSRFPGLPRQDPVLLDRERAGISPHLPKSARRRQLREKAFGRLLGRLRGRVFLSHSLADSAGARELYPASVFARLKEEHPPETPAPTAVLVPRRRSQSLAPREDWLAALLEQPPAGVSCSRLEPWFPRLAAGARAAAARESAVFTEYDGNVPEAGPLCDPRAGRVFSPSDLELLATCPMEYFFRKVLGIRRPERYEPRPGQWLEGNQRGSLLHDLFQDFLDRLDREGETVEEAKWDGQYALLADLLARAIARYRHRFPPGDILAFRREERELYEAAGIFLQTEAGRQKLGRPLYREVALGGAEQERTPWDRRDPVPVRLPSGAEMLLRGRVDRIDRLEGGGLVVIDYKTGRSAAFSRGDPFRQGRHLQPLLYTLMLEAALEAMGKPEPVRAFAYFFPMPRDEGLLLSYGRDILDRAGLEIVAGLEKLLAEGRFPFTLDQDDVKYSDYRPVYGDIGKLAASSRAKALADPALAAWRDLREFGR